MPRTEKAERGEAGPESSSRFNLALLRKASVPYLAIFAQYFSFGGVVTLLPLYIADFGMEAFHVGVLLSIFSLTFILTQLLGGNLCDRIGRLRPIAFGLALGALSLVMLSLSGLFAILAVTMVLYGAAYGLIFPSISALIADSVKAGEYGIATGIFHALITLGVAVGAPFMALIAIYTGIGTGLALLGIVFLPALIATVVQIQKERKTEVVG
jgi:MFS family permease